jgi:hypothetical protein
MAVAKLKGPRDADDPAVIDRVRRGRPPERSGKWTALARELVRERPDLNLKGVLDMHDSLAGILEYQGAPRAEAEHYGWEQCVDILTRSSK